MNTLAGGIGNVGFVKRPTVPEDISRLKSRKTIQSGKSFQEVLKGETSAGTSDVKFSAHAASRLESRDINLTQVKKDQLNEAVERAAHKGSKESLVLLDDLAFLVSVKNRTVITAIHRDNLKDKVFTNIDSTVVL